MSDIISVQDDFVHLCSSVLFHTSSGNVHVFKILKIPISKATCLDRLYIFNFIKVNTEHVVHMGNAVSGQSPEDTAILVLKEVC